jgi:hypothetical protein
MSPEQSIVVRVIRRFEASAERVFDAWLDSRKVGRWLFATSAGQQVRCELDARPGGSFSLVERHDGEDWEHEGKYQEMGGVVEVFVEGAEKRSPSVQNRVNAAGAAMAISTHDQVLGGPSGQVFLGATFPADDAYRLDVQRAGLRIAEVLAGRGVLGRFATDFVSVKENGVWRHHAIEVNLRKGGTTHPFLTLRFLTDGKYDVDTGLFHSQSGRAKYYYASDSVQSDAYKGLGPTDLVDIVMMNELHFHPATERGVVFHLIGALSEYGKLGMVCIGDNPQQAEFLYQRTRAVLDQVTRREGDPPSSAPASTSGGARGPAPGSSAS